MSAESNGSVVTPRRRHRRHLLPDAAPHVVALGGCEDPSRAPAAHRVDEVAAGGRSGVSLILATSERYDIRSGVWEQVAAMPTARQDLAAAAFR